MDNQGTILASDSSIAVSDFLNDGTAAELDSRGLVSFVGTTIDPASQGSFEVEVASTLDLGSNTNVGDATINFNDGLLVEDYHGGTLAIDSSVGSFAGTIADFSSLDALELKGGTITEADYDGNGTLSVHESDAAFYFTNLFLASAQAAGPVGFSNQGGNGFVFVGQTMPIPCFVRGTHILTSEGNIPVEALRVGDRVITRSGRRRPIVWIGRRALSPAAHHDPDSVQPILVRRDAFAPGRPARDLWLSPGHCVAFGGALIPIGALRNGETILQVPRDRVEYWHVQLDEHDLLRAEGLAVESYLETGTGDTFAASLVAARRPVAGVSCAPCLPLACDGPIVTRLLARLSRRAARRDRDSLQPMPAAA